jgi:hypothetical protein
MRVFVRKSSATETTQLPWSYELRRELRSGRFDETLGLNREHESVGVFAGARAI